MEFIQTAFAQLFYRIDGLLVEGDIQYLQSNHLENLNGKIGTARKTTDQLCQKIGVNENTDGKAIKLKNARDEQGQPYTEYQTSEDVDLNTFCLIAELL